MKIHIENLFGFDVSGYLVHTSQIEVFTYNCGYINLYINVGKDSKLTFLIVYYDINGKPTIKEEVESFILNRTEIYDEDSWKRIPDILRGF